MIIPNLSSRVILWMLLSHWMFGNSVPRVECSRIATGDTNSALRPWERITRRLRNLRDVVSGRCIEDGEEFQGYAAQFTKESDALRTLSRANGYLEHIGYDGKLRYGVPGEEIHPIERKDFVLFDEGPTEDDVMLARHVLINSLMTNFAMSRDDAEEMTSKEAIGSKGKGYADVQERLQEFVRLLAKKGDSHFRYCFVELNTNESTIIAGVNVMLFPSGDPEIKLKNFGLAYMVGIAKRPVYQLVPYAKKGLTERLEQTVSSWSIEHGASCLVAPAPIGPMPEKLMNFGWYMAHKQCEEEERQIGEKALELTTYHSGLFSTRHLAYLTQRSAVKPFRSDAIENAFTELENLK